MTRSRPNFTSCLAASRSSKAGFEEPLIRQRLDRIGQGPHRRGEDLQGVDPRHGAHGAEIGTIGACSGRHDRAVSPAHVDSLPVSHRLSSSPSAQASGEFLRVGVCDRLGPDRTDAGGRPASRDAAAWPSIRRHHGHHHSGRASDAQPWTAQRLFHRRADRRDRRLHLDGIDLSEQFCSVLHRQRHHGRVQRLRAAFALCRGGGGRRLLSAQGDLAGAGGRRGGGRHRPAAGDHRHGVLCAFHLRRRLYVRRLAVARHDPSAGSAAHPAAVGSGHCGTAAPIDRDRCASPPSSPPCSPRSSATARWSSS